MAAPKVGDRVDGYVVAKVEDYGHDTAMRYTMEDGTTVYGAHWDFDACECGRWHYNRKVHSDWASD